MTPAQQPALFQTQKGETITRPAGLPPRRTLAVDLVLYAVSGDSAVAPASLLNPLIDAVEAALEPGPAFAKQTLGGLVSHCCVSGRVEIVEGVLGAQAVAIVPIEIVVP